MIEWGYESYEREHTILVGWTDEYAKQHPDKIDNYLKVRMHNLCPVEFYLRHLLARQSHDTSERLKDIKHPTLILVGDGDRNMTSEINHRMSSEILAKGIPNSKLVVLPNELHSYSFTNPDQAHTLMAVGSDDGDMALCPNALLEAGGGIAIADRGAILEKLDF